MKKAKRYIVSACLLLTWCLGWSQCPPQTMVSKAKVKIRNFPKEIVKFKILPDLATVCQSIAEDGYWLVYLPQDYKLQDLKLVIEKNGVTFTKLVGPGLISHEGACVAEFIFEAKCDLLIYSQQSFYISAMEHERVLANTQFIIEKPEITSAVSGKIFLNQNVPADRQPYFDFSYQLTELVKKEKIQLNSDQITRRVLECTIKNRAPNDVEVYITGKIVRSAGPKTITFQIKK